jgi:transcriptional regulator with XRE-family HTH domain
MSWQSLQEQGNVLLDLAEKQRRVQERLARYRAEMAPPGKKRLTQEEAADAAGVPLRQWQRWEKGETVPHLSNLARLSTALGIPLDDFRDVTPDAEPGPPQDDTLAELLRNQQRAFSMLESIATQLDAISEQVESSREQSEPKSEEPRRATGRRPRRAA